MPSSWRSDRVKDILSQSFRGGRAIENVTSGTVRNQLGERGHALGGAAGLLLVGAALLGGGSLGDSEAQQLNKRIAQLEGSASFEFLDAKGNSHDWPYADAPEEMAGLIEPPSRPADHAFALVEAGQLSMEALAERFGYNSLELTLRNHTERTLTLRLPAGALFVPKDSGMQPLLLQKPVEVTLIPSEGQTLQLHTFCGDSSARVPRSQMVLSPYELSQEHLHSQGSVWQWSARYQRRHHQSADGSTCCEAEDILLESFGIRAQELVPMLSEYGRLMAEGDSRRSRLLDETRLKLTARHKELERMRRERSRSSGGSSGGITSFGGGHSSGGGAGSSW